MAAVMAAAGGHLYAAALGADDVAEYVTLNRRGGDRNGGLQDEHQRRGESREACNADPANVLPHGLPQFGARPTTPHRRRKPPGGICGKMPGRAGR